VTIVDNAAWPAVKASVSVLRLRASRAAFVCQRPSTRRPVTRMSPTGQANSTARKTAGTASSASRARIPRFTE
jgi:hypothetical protein